MPSKPWQPTSFLRWEKSYSTSVGTARIVTDAGPAFIKPLGNREGPHVLACDWVGTALAKWFGLLTADCAIMEIDSDRDEIHLGRDMRLAAAGPAFVSRKVDGHTWGGSAAELERLENPGDIARLVVFDTWTLNCDRYFPGPRHVRENRDNVFLASEGAGEGKWRLMAIDHTHCFTCGRDLTPRTDAADRAMHDGLFGLFPEFEPYLMRANVQEAAEKLASLQPSDYAPIVDSIPAAWEVSGAARAALKRLIAKRATYVSQTVVENLKPYFPAEQQWLEWPEED